MCCVCVRVCNQRCVINIISFCVSVRGDWVCTLCRTDQDPVDAYECENVHSCRGAKAPYTLSNQEQRVSRCCGYFFNLHL